MDPVFDSPRGGLPVGSDKVVVFEDRVVVFAARAMPDWEIREFNRIPIWFQDRKYFIRRKARLDHPYAMGYELAPWPEDLHQESSLSVTYDPRYVASRDQLFRSERRDEIGRWLLYPFFPLLGFFWSRFKDRGLERFGFNPVSVTEGSLLLSLGIFMAEGVFVLYFHLGLWQVLLGLGSNWPDCVGWAALGADLTVRYNQVLRGDDAPDGFLEWVFRIKRRAKSTKD